MKIRQLVRVLWYSQISTKIRVECAQIEKWHFTEMVLSIINVIFFYLVFFFAHALNMKFNLKKKVCIISLFKYTYM